MKWKRRLKKKNTLNNQREQSRISKEWWTVITWSKNRLMWTEFWELVKKTPVKKDKSCNLNFFKTKNFFELWFYDLPGYRKIQVSLHQIFPYNYILLFVYIPIWKIYVFHIHHVLGIIHSTPVILLNPWSITCLILWINLAII